MITATAPDYLPSSDYTFECPAIPEANPALVETACATSETAPKRLDGTENITTIATSLEDQGFTVNRVELGARKWLQAHNTNLPALAYAYHDETAKATHLMAYHEDDANPDAATKIYTRILDDMSLDQRDHAITSFQAKMMKNNITRP